MKKLLILFLLLSTYLLTGCSNTEIDTLTENLTTLNEKVSALEEDDTVPPVFNGITEYSFDNSFNNLYEYTTNPDILMYSGVFFDNVFYNVMSGLIEENITAIDNVDGDITDYIIYMIPSITEVSLEYNNIVTIKLLVTDSSGNTRTQNITVTFIYE